MLMSVLRETSRTFSVLSKQDLLFSHNWLLTLNPKSADSQARPLFTTPTVLIIMTYVI